GSSCEPGRTFRDRCNTCKCGADGRSAACTLRACPNQ
nr:Chain A, Protease inhibitor LCMI-II [Locusta migratoria]7SGQ_B Chain B, Protease inhibitor LCMI-II [Locusta migratoria]7SGQ_C Chain C, Protease inhibitor LCMI-II [Locusta migratoria]7SGQ_D Chain D, Protease inhibitor LCMI-II [Locusta migratoria]7SGQ_E Chain E, Protease inhibitor LCMI-II [Locusta migratoria]7SGQ_F Chain F, Protease inhibitor LCMI-II [Locusta migratoria]